MRGKKKKERKERKIIIKRVVISSRLKYQTGSGKYWKIQIIMIKESSTFTEHEHVIQVVNCGT